MKTKFTRRILSAVLTLGMVLSMLPVTAFAQTVTSTPGDKDLEVEYFNSTLYNWTEAEANAAAEKADKGVQKLTSTNLLNDAVQWCITKVKEDIYTISVDGKYLTWSGNNSADAKLMGKETLLTLTDGTNSDSGEDIVTIGLSGSSATYKYLNYYNASGLGGWKQDGSQDVGSAFKIATAAENGNLTYIKAADIISGNKYYIVSVRGLTNNSGYLKLVTDESAYEGMGFYFTESSGKPADNKYIPAFSKWIKTKDTNQIDTQNYYIYSGLAADKLSESSNAPFSNSVNAANLFASTNNDYTDVYTNIKVPFIYDAQTGYYELNSDKNAVYFENGSGNPDATMLIADLPAGYTGYSGSNNKVTGFVPFNSLQSTSSDGYNTAGLASTTKAYPISGTIEYGFGMVTSVDFQMTDTGKDANGNDIEFQFAGDDDVWVYIDGILALDVGGTHDAITGTINFVTGDVTLSSPYGKVGDKADDEDMSGYEELEKTLSQTNLYTALGTTLTGFAAQGNHTLTIYYMDRGQGRTNCLIRFNLPQRDSVSVTKNISDYYLDESHNTSNDQIPSEVMANLSNIDFSYTLYKDDEAVANKSYSLYDSDGNFLSTGSTDAKGGFTLKNGQTATFRGISLDERSSWYVKENLTTGVKSRWEAVWNASSSVTGAKTAEVTLGEGETGVPSQKVTVTGSSSTTDTITFVCTNSYQRGPDPDVDIHDDTIVLDYGLPVSVDVMANDVVTNYGEIIKNGENGTITMGISDTADGYNPDNYTGTINNGVFTGKYGTAEVKDGKIVYTLTRDFCGIEKIPYSVTATVTLVDDTSKSTTVTGTLTVIPATSVYYEENFGPENNKMVTTKTNYAEFTTEGTSLTGYQETGLVGTTTDSTYGADKVYLDNLGDSYGTSLKVDTTDGAAQYSYSFTGTGTAIYGRVSNKTGYIRVKVTDKAGTVVDTQYIDTINYITVPEGETDQILDTVLYNIPIYQNTELGSEGSSYDTYTVTIYVYKSGTLHEGNNEFYLDGIRVFQPMGTSEEDNTEYASAESAYSADGEQNIAVVNIREKLVADSENEYADDVFTLTDINGEIVDVTEYNDIGPNQELYLKERYNGSFALVNWDSKSYKLYLGMKAPNGKASEVTVGSGTFAINNSADCYYDISDYVEADTLDDGTVVGYVNIEGVSGLTALTNLKVTGVDEFNLSYSNDLTVDNEEENNTGSDEGQTENTLYLVSRTYADNMAAAEEIQVFTPDSIKTSCSYASKSKKATVNVVTSKDVDYVTINGVKVTGKNVSGKLRFTKSYNKVAAGTAYEIVAYNADGMASAVYTVTAE